MARRILVLCASRSGSTAEIAAAIAQALCERGHVAEVRAAREVVDLAGWDAVVLGSAVRYGAWLAEMTDAVARLRDQLAARPLAIFTVHLEALDDSDASRARRARYTEAVKRLVTPRAEAWFAGCLDPTRLSLIERLALRLVGAEHGDKRDWQRIRTWADGLEAVLFPVTAVA